MDYTQITPDEQTAMLDAIGADSVDDLFGAIPPDVRFRDELDLPPARSELELQRELEEMRLSRILVDAKLAASSSEARRLVDQGAVRVNDVKVESDRSAAGLRAGDIISVGRRGWLRLEGGES